MVTRLVISYISLIRSKKVSVAKARMIRLMYGETKKDRVGNEYIEELQKLYKSRTK